MAFAFSKVLVANRGEIAVRIIRACREAGLGTVAVYSDADSAAMHVRMADEAYRLGPAPSAESYLSIAKILEVARLSGAEAVHPGYGFLSENAAFAEAVRAAGLAFIGPSPEAIRAMGDKAAARAAMEAAGVPVVPGYHGRPGVEALGGVSRGAPDDAELLAAAAGLGYPLLVKARAGGGGRGMRVVREAGELPAALVAARREALHAFGDGSLLLERYIARAHHVEFQVFGDSAGRVVHLLERECSVQRRHQKIIEESPSPLLDDGLRKRMGDAAVKAAKTAGYSNAGTVEFIVDPETREFYFLEMNTRLQVEHPVTELVTGIDLVRLQIRVASGEALPFAQEDIRGRGHAIECRLYAEDPERGFMPSSGPLLRYVEPAGPGIRVDSGFAEGDAIDLHYDPLVAKISCLAEDRQAALARMRGALSGTAVAGPTTNLEFLLEVLEAPDFAKATMHTTWIEENMGGWKSKSGEPSPELLAAAAIILGMAAESRDPAGPSDPDGKGDQRGLGGPWSADDGFRAGRKR
ncbi:MAG TPA: acetyl-CoA carboxylase biotin carboxylase subunit [Rectinemataceae bacterium]|nr:acetyl-CoA carboxylase biotin carboxylase subunit [Rectinemataceae bacterium]